MAWWIPLALAAGSMYANNRSQQQRDDAISNARRKNIVANQKEEDAANAAVLRQQSEYGNFDERQAEAQEDLGSQFVGAQNYQADRDPNAQVADTDGAETGNRIIDANNRRNEGSKRYTSKLAQALADMRGTEQGFLDAALGGRDDLQDVRRAQGNMRGNNRLLNADLAAAQQEGKGWGTVGDGLSLAAMVAAPMSLAAAPASANATGAAMSVGGGSAVPVLGSAGHAASPGAWAQILGKGRKVAPVVIPGGI